MFPFILMPFQSSNGAGILIPTLIYLFSNNGPGSVDFKVYKTLFHTFPVNNMSGLIPCINYFFHSAGELSYGSVAVNAITVTLSFSSSSSFVIDGLAGDACDCSVI